MQHARITMARTTAHVMKDGLEMDFLVQVGIFSFSLSYVYSFYQDIGTLYYFFVFWK